MNGLWRDAWPSKPKTGAILSCLALLGAGVGAVVGLLQGDVSPAAAVGLLVGYLVGCVWMFAAVATGRSAARRLPVPAAGVLVAPSSNVRQTAAPTTAVDEETS